MKIYHYNNITNEMVGESEARLDPIDKIALIPASATNIKPSKIGANQVSVFTHGEWLIKDDYRGVKGFDSQGVEQEITEIGVIPDKSWTDDRIYTQTELDAIAYAQAKQDKILAVSQITVTTTSGNVFDGDEVSQNRMARAVTASNAGDTTQWILADNTQATVTHEELKEALLLSGEATIKIWMA